MPNFVEFNHLIFMVLGYALRAYARAFDLSALPIRPKHPDSGRVRFAYTPGYEYGGFQPPRYTNPDSGRAHISRFRARTSPDSGRVRFAYTPGYEYGGFQPP